MLSGSEELVPHPNIRRGKLSPDKSLRFAIRKSYPNGMRPSFMQPILRDILLGLDHLHSKWQFGHEKTSSADIFYIPGEGQAGCATGLSYDEEKPAVLCPAKPWEKGRTKTDGIWGLGMIALEMAYGSLPEVEWDDLALMGKNMVSYLKLKFLDDGNLSELRKLCKLREIKVIDEEEEKEKKAEEAKKKGKEKEDKEKEEKQAEKSMKKGKEKVNQAKEKEKEAENALERGKEKEYQKEEIKLPKLEDLINTEYTESLLGKLALEKYYKIKKKNVEEISEKLKKIEDKMEKQFPRYFLQVVMQILDSPPTPTAQLLDNPFFTRCPSTFRESKWLKWFGKEAE